MAQEASKENPKSQIGFKNMVLYRGGSDLHQPTILREGFKPSTLDVPPYPKWVYLATKFYDATRFAFSSSKEEGGNPIVYKLEVPISKISGKVMFPIRDGWIFSRFLVSKEPLSPEVIIEIIPLPADMREFERISDKYEAEERLREGKLRELLLRIPEIKHPKA